ncbi:MAG: AraC family transcriptional regulator [Clostridia bacterium]|nr:AraC family transcriptional regulator [Clostridia bacterium]
MTVKEVVKALNLECLTGGEELDREVNGGYCGDLLSWVMSKAQSGNAWITIMSNINIVAVAVLTDVSCIILCEDVTPEEDCIQKAEEQGVVILKSSMSAFELANKIGNLI